MITILSHRGDRSIREDIDQFIDHEEPALRLAGIQALSMVATSDDVLFMAQNAAVKRDREQELFRNALYRLQGADIDDTILREASQLHNNVAVELIKAIAEGGHEEAIGLLLAKAKSGHPGVRIEACRSLGKISRIEHISQIIDLLADTDTSRERQELERAIYLAATRHEQQMANTKQVQEYIEQTPATRDKASLIAVLGNIKNNEDLPLLLAYLEHEEIDLQLAAIRALTDWPNSRPADKLMTTAGSSPDIRVQTLAIRACNRVIINDGQLSNEMKALKLTHALELAPNANEKRQVISAMMRAPSFEAFETLINNLGEDSLKTELELAIINMAPALMRIDKTKTSSEIERALTMIDSEDLRNMLNNSR
jgi:HEAT repeat protein